MKSIQIFAFLGLIYCSSATLVLRFDDKVENCAKTTGSIDMDWEVLQEGEEEAYLNGTWRILSDIKAPLPLKLYTRKFESGEWSEISLKRSVPDFCALIHSPLEVWHSITKDVPKCPWKKGAVIEFNMVPLSFAGLQMTRALEGEWKVFMDAYYSVKGVKKDLCMILKLDVVDF